MFIQIQLLFLARFPLNGIRLIGSFLFFGYVVAVVLMSTVWEIH